MAEPDAVAEALMTVRAEQTRLIADVTARQAAELRSTEHATALRDKLATRRNALMAERSRLEERITGLQRRQDVALDRRKRLRKARNLLLRLPLGAAAVLGWLMAVTTDANAAVGLVLVLVEGASLWWLADWADHLGMRDG